jgi:gamma-glutamylcysteine synthetase
MFRNLWLNFAYNAILALVNKKIAQEELLKKVVQKVLDTLKRLVGVLTDNDPNDQVQALALWQEQKQEIADLGLEYAIEIINSKITDETARLIAEQAAQTLAETLKMTKNNPS